MSHRSCALHLLASNGISGRVVRDRDAQWKPHDEHQLVGLGNIYLVTTLKLATVIELALHLLRALFIFFDL